MITARLVLPGMCLTMLTACADPGITRPADVSAAPANNSAYVLRQLPLPAFSTKGAALAVNDSGWIVGWTDSVGGSHGGISPTVWRPSRAPQRLQFFRAWGSYAVDINNAGRILGNGFIQYPRENSMMLWDANEVQIGQVQTTTFPHGQNSSGVIATDVCNLDYRATLFYSVYIRTDLSCLNAGMWCWGHAYSINDAGYAVGTFTLRAGGEKPRAVIWDPGNNAASPSARRPRGRRHAHTARRPMP